MSRAKQVIPWILVLAFAGLSASIWFYMRAQVEDRNAEITDLQTKYNQLVRDSNLKLNETASKCNELVADANKKLGEASEKYRALSEDATSRIEQANQREVEVKVGFRKALLHAGFVAVISNLANESAAFTVEASRPSSGAHRTYELTLDRAQLKEIGELEGWAFVSGDTLTVSRPNHKSLVFTVQ